MSYLNQYFRNKYIGTYTLSHLLLQDAELPSDLYLLHATYGVDVLGLPKALFDQYWGTSRVDVMLERVIPEAARAAIVAEFGDYEFGIYPRGFAPGRPSH